MTIYEIGNRKFRAVKKISEGGFGFVYLVAAVSDSTRTFALKKIIAQNTEKIHSASQELAFLQQHCAKGNSHLMNYEDCKVINNADGSKVFYMLVEHCSTGTLFDLMSERSRDGKYFEEQELLCLLRTITRSLHALHALGFTHYDLKIENLLFFDWKTIKLCDFGSVSQVTADFSRMSLAEIYECESFFETRTTLMYKPPEMCDPYLRYAVDSKADLWMLGCILYTLMFFRHPFAEKSKLEISMAKFVWPAAPVYSSRLQNLVRNLLTPNPALRPGTAELIEHLSLEGVIMELNAQAYSIKSESTSISKQLDCVGRKKAQSVPQTSSQNFDFDFLAFDQKSAQKRQSADSERRKNEKEPLVGLRQQTSKSHNEILTLFTFDGPASPLHRPVHIFNSKPKTPLCSPPTNAIPKPHINKDGFGHKDPFSFSEVSQEQPFSSDHLFKLAPKIYEQNSLEWQNRIGF